MAEAAAPPHPQPGLQKSGSTGSGASSHIEIWQPLLDGWAEDPASQPVTWRTVSHLWLVSRRLYGLGACGSMV